MDTKLKSRTPNAASIVSIHDFIGAIKNVAERRKLDVLGGEIEQSLLAHGKYDAAAIQLGCTHATTSTLHFGDHIVVVTLPLAPVCTDQEGVKKISALNHIEFFADESDNEPESICEFTLFRPAFEYAVGLMKQTQPSDLDDSYRGQFGDARIEIVRWHQDAESRIGILVLGNSLWRVPLILVNEDWTVIDNQQLLEALSTPFPAAGSGGELDRFFDRVEAMALRYNLVAKGFGNVEHQGEGVRSIMRFHTEAGDAIHFIFNTETIY